ncbi:MAG: WYL domain-containing protein [Candidatus Sericytochromatia bacterium]|nr:WYL domain-containing protein [Candidatus Tanganyikabacteria bacterium]
MRGQRQATGKKGLAEPLRRLFALAVALLERPRRREELALVGVADPRDPSSVTRDINALRSLGWEIRSRGGRPYTLYTGNIPLLVDTGEARALLLMAELAEQAGFPDHDVLRRLVARIPAPIRSGAAADGRVRIHPSLVGYRPHDATLRLIRQSLARGRRMRLVYGHPWHDESRTYLVDAAELSWIDGTLILFAFCPEAPGAHDAQKTREFRVDRILAVQPTSLACERSFAPKFSFTYRILPGLRRAFGAPGSHRLLAEAADGTLTLRGVANTEFRAQRYLLAFGPYAEAVAPESLRSRLARVSAETAEIYRSG